MKIEKPVVKLFKIGTDLLNVEFENVLEEFNHMDLFAFNTNGDSCEIEIKVSDYDFHKEFTKAQKVFKHDSYKRNMLSGTGFCPTRFYFMTLDNIREAALKKIERLRPYYGLITYSPYNGGKLRVVRKSERLTEMPFTGEILDTPYRDFKHKRTLSI